MVSCSAGLGWITFNLRAQRPANLRAFALERIHMIAVFDTIFAILKIVAIIFSPLLIIFGNLIIQFMIRLFIHVTIKKQRLPKRGTVKKLKVLRALFFDFPRQFFEDSVSKEDYEFGAYGVHMFCGEQGSGKSTALIHLLNKWRDQYPKAIFCTNMGYKHEVMNLEHWKELIEVENGKQGAVMVLDEIQTWFSSNDSKNFDPSMLGEISQQRKARKAIVGTAQVFSRVSKQIREQTHFVYLPMTLMGCLTIVRKSHPKYWNDEKQRFTRYTGHYFFVHTPEIRNCFDTYERITRYKEVGFKSAVEIQSLLNDRRLDDAI